MRDPVRRHIPAILVSLVLPAFASGTALAQDNPQAPVLSKLNLNFTTQPSASVAPSDDTQGAAKPAAAAPTEGGAGFGFYIGPTFSKVSGSNATFTTAGTPGSTSNHTGWAGGFFVGGGRSRMIALESGLYYVQKGAKDSNGTTAKLHYFEVPVLVKVNGGAKSGPGVSFNGFGGFAVAILDASDVNPCQVAAGAPAGSPCATRQHFLVQGSEPVGIVGAGVEARKILFQLRAEFSMRQLLVNTTLSGKNISYLVLFGYRLN